MDDRESVARAGAADRLLDPGTTGTTSLGHADSSLALYVERFAPGHVASSTRVALADGVVPTREGLDAGDRVAVAPHGVVE